MKFSFALLLFSIYFIESYASSVTLLDISGYYYNAKYNMDLLNIELIENIITRINSTTLSEYIQYISCKPLPFMKPFSNNNIDSVLELDKLLQEIDDVDELLYRLRGSYAIDSKDWRVLSYTNYDEFKAYNLIKMMEIRKYYYMKKYDYDLLIREYGSINNILKQILNSY
jgi:hypothetical protein